MPKMTFVCALHSEVVRMRHSSLVVLHLALAVVLGGCAGWYFSYAAWDSLLGVDAFFQVLGSAAPLLVGLSCGLAVDTEREAGDYANLLGVSSRRVAFVAKGVVLFALGLTAALVAAVLFFGILALAGRSTPSLGACFAAVGGLAAGSIFLYATFLWVALRFGRNAAIGLSALGLIVAFASMGGLANGLVTGTFTGSFGIDTAVFMPFAWPSRFASLIIELSISQPLALATSELALLITSLVRVGVACSVATFALVGLLLARVNRFEDARRLEQ